VCVCARAHTHTHEVRAVCHKCHKCTLALQHQMREHTKQGRGNANCGSEPGVVYIYFELFSDSKERRRRVAAALKEAVTHTRGTRVSNIRGLARH